MNTVFKHVYVCWFILLSSFAQQASAIYIDLNFTGGLTASQQSIFSDAELFWETTLTGYQPSVNLSSNITINAEGATIDGAGGILGSAGPTYGWNNGGYILTAEGDMRFDVADLAYLESNGLLQSVILHEMAHVLGFGTLWEQNGVYVAGSGQYTGAHALSLWKTEFGQLNATYVPIELGGAAGTAGSHWNENDGGSWLTGITDSNGNDMRNELMTGWLGSSTFVSDMTKISFADIGYEVSAVPLPAAAWFFITALACLVAVRANFTT